MGVTSFRGDVWQSGNNVLHRALIKYCQNEMGPAAFLDDFQRSFDYGYNHIDLDGLSANEVRDYRDCIAALISQSPECVQADLGVSFGGQNVCSGLRELVDLIDRKLPHAP